MRSNKDDLERVFAAIRDVLLRDWDPIGVMNDPDMPRDEYDSYIGEIYRFLARGESAEVLAKHLYFIEDKLMRVRVAPESALLSVATKLKMIDVGLPSSH